VCMCACLPVFTCVLVDLFCPPPPTTTTVLPIPPPVCPSSPHFHFFWKCVWKCPQDGECGSRVGKKHYRSIPPQVKTLPSLSLTIYSRMKCRLGGRNMVPVGVWPTLILRGVSQPTLDSPEAPSAIFLCKYP
jgi:hypothetical protein